MKKISPPSIVTQDPWNRLKEFTDARIGLGRAGTSMPVSEYLKLKLAHAQARDAVHQPFDKKTIMQRLQDEEIPYQLLESAVVDRYEYLTRPDKGRMLNETSREKLSQGTKGFDICFVVCDGLSTRAIHENCVELILSLWRLASWASYSLAPVQIVQNGRVAIGDEIGQLLEAQMAIVLIGERPGLSSPNSLGIYMTYGPKIGKTDETRNCISNVREKGMTMTNAVQKLAYLIERSFAEQRSGVLLKDTMQQNYIPFNSTPACR